MWDGIIYPFPNLNGATSLGMVSDIIPHFARLKLDSYDSYSDCNQVNSKYFINLRKNHFIEPALVSYRSVGVHEFTSAYVILKNSLLSFL